MTAVAPAPALPARPRPGDENRVVTVFANLLPDEVVATRRLRELKRRLLLGLAALVVLLVGVYGLSWWQTGSAQDDLDSAQAQTVTLTQRLNDYGPLLAAQAKAASIGSTLSTLMATDLSWRDLIARVQQAGADIKITSVDGAVTPPSASGDAAGGQLAPFNTSGDTIVGTLTIGGTARDDRSIATFVERLGSVTGVTSPLPASVTSTDGTRTFSINALITGKALGGRYTKTTGGK